MKQEYICGKRSRKKAILLKGDIKMKRFLLAIVVSLLVFCGGNVKAEAAPKTMADGGVFDAEFYAVQYPDVAAVFGTDENMLYMHYTLCGQAEGRLPYNPVTATPEAANPMVLTANNDVAYAAAVNATLRPTDSTYFELKTALPGTYITFGTYEQDNKKKNGQEPIEWLVLENNGESILVISKYVLDGQPYSNAYDTYKYQPYPITWEYCSLRAWLNSTFYTTAFTEGERARIQTTLLSNKAKAMFNEKVDGGNDTLDNVFLLSYEEVLRYFPMKDIWYSSDGSPVNYDKLLQAKVTPYAVAQGAAVWTEKEAKSCLSYGGGYKNIAYDVIGYAQHWALRTLCSQVSAYDVGASGSFGFRTVTYDLSNRPAMRINIQ